MQSFSAQNPGFNHHPRISSRKQCLSRCVCMEADKKETLWSYHSALLALPCVFPQWGGHQSTEVSNKRETIWKFLPPPPPGAGSEDSLSCPDILYVQNFALEEPCGFFSRRTEKPHVSFLAANGKSHWIRITGNSMRTPCMNKWSRSLSC